jgi:hypothetical protein
VSSPARWFGCADAARQRLDPLTGTAPYARGWLLIEHPGPWRVDALAGSGIAVEVLSQLDDAARASQSRILLIRRPRGRPHANRRWAAVHPTRGTVWGHWHHDSDLLAAARALLNPEPDGDRETPLLLVCTHGVHDTCCSVRGRPVAAALAKEWPEYAWECSHVGGDRFAANLVVLPDGAYYGNLDADSAVEAVRRHLSGYLDLPHLRGLATLTPIAQSAVTAVHEAHGPWRIEAVQVISVRETTGPGWHVTMTSPAGQLVAEVRTSLRPAGLLTCRAVADTSALEYRVTELSAVQRFS